MEENRFQRLTKVIGEESVDYLHSKTVLVLGCGGVGGYVIEALARSNIGTLIIIDHDDIDITNINRQIIALTSNVGRKKVDVWEERIQDINPNCKVIKMASFIDDKNIEELFSYQIDYFVDACDTLLTKKAIIKECLERKIPFISSMGTGNKLDPSKLEIVELSKTNNDPLARILRKYVKDERIKGKIMVLSSQEVPIKTHERTPGSTSFVPSSAGLLIASYIVKKILNL